MFQRSKVLLCTKRLFKIWGLKYVYNIFIFLLLQCHIQATLGGQTPTMWALATFLCWDAPRLMLTRTWPGAEGVGTFPACHMEWKSGTGYCGFNLCRCLIMDPTSVRKGMEPSRRSFLLPELKLAYPAAVSPFIFFFLGIGLHRGWGFGCQCPVDRVLICLRL